MCNGCNKDAVLYSLSLGSSGGKRNKIESNDGKQVIPSFISGWETTCDKITGNRQFWAAVTFYATRINEEYFLRFQEMKDSQRTQIFLKILHSFRRK